MDTSSVATTIPPKTPSTTCNLTAHLGRDDATRCNPRRNFGARSGPTIQKKGGLSARATGLAHMSHVTCELEHFGYSHLAALRWGALVRVFLFYRSLLRNMSRSLGSDSEGKSWRAMLSGTSAARLMVTTPAQSRHTESPCGQQ
jgi:hypothetical protein